MTLQVVNLDRMADVAAAAPAEGEQQGVIIIFILFNCQIRNLISRNAQKTLKFCSGHYVVILIVY